MPMPVTVEGLGVRLALNRTSCTLLVMGTLLLGMPDAGIAQTVPRTFDDLRAESHQGETVYVTDVAGATTKGRVLRISANSIALIVKNQTRDWPASEVRWITQRRGSAGRGALIGLAVGAVLGPVLVPSTVEVMTMCCFSPLSPPASGAASARRSARQGDRSVSCTLRAVVRLRFWWRRVWRRALLSGARKSASEWPPRAGESYV